MFRFLLVTAPLAAFFSTCVCGPALRAEDIQWGGIATTDWHTLGNWDAFYDPFPTIVQRVPINGDTASLSDTTNGNLVTLSDNTAGIDGLTVENGFTLDTQGYLLLVDQVSSAATRIDGTNSRIIVDELLASPSSRGFDTDVLTVINGGWLSLNSGIAHIDVDSYVGYTSEIVGNGLVQFNSMSGIVLRNDGTIRVGGAVPGSLNKTLTLQTSGSASLDLDGQFFSGREWGVLDVDDGTGIFSGNLTMRIDAPLADGFTSNITIGRGDTLELQRLWNQDGGTIEMRGATGVATLRSTTMGLDDATLSVVSGTAVLDTGNLITSNSTIDVGATLQVDGTVSLLASADLDLNDADALIVNGTLTVNQAVIDLDGDLLGDNTITVNPGGNLTLNVDAIEDDMAADFDGTLEIGGTVKANVTGGWINDGTISLQGGVLQGTQLTNWDLLTGRGAVTSSGIVNDGEISAVGGTLVLQPSGGTKDLDGTTGSGVLNALSGNLDLQMGDITFEGTANIGSGRIIRTDGDFTLDDGSGPGVIEITGGRFEAGKDFNNRGNLVVEGGPVTIAASSGSAIEYIRFYSGSTTNINTDLTLEPAYGSIVRAGAVVNGTGRLINPPGARMFADAYSNIGVEYVNQGRTILGYLAPHAVGPVDVAEYVQTDSGDLLIQIYDETFFDRLLVAAKATLDGMLSVYQTDPAGSGFVPEAGDAWEILTADKVVGEFDLLDDSGAELKPGLFWDVEYSTTNVVLFVREPFEADFDEDGDVDDADLVLWEAGYGLAGSALHHDGDADDDGDVDGNDLLIWQQQLGSRVIPTLSTITAVPELGTLLLAALGISMGLLTRQKWE